MKLSLSITALFLAHIVAVRGYPVMRHERSMALEYRYINDAPLMELSARYAPDYSNEITARAPTKSHSSTQQSELKLHRLNKENERLREDLERPRLRVSEASASLIHYSSSTKDHLVPSVWGQVSRAQDPYKKHTGGK